MIQVNLPCIQLSMPKEKSLDGLDAFYEINSPNALVILQTRTQIFLLSSVVDVADTCRLFKLEFSLYYFVASYIPCKNSIVDCVPLSFNHQ
jgi:hypothetical protein